MSTDDKGATVTNEASELRIHGPAMSLLETTNVAMPETKACRAKACRVKKRHGRVALYIPEVKTTD